MEPIEVRLGLVELDATAGLVVGEEFDVTFSAENVSGTGNRTAFSFYTDVTFDPAVISAQSISYNEDGVSGSYSEFQSGTIDNVTGIIDEAGATTNFFSQPSSPTPLIFTVRFQLLQNSEINIGTNPAEGGFSQITFVGFDGDLADSRTSFGSLAANETVNEAPVATNDIVITNEDVVATGNVLTNDTDSGTDPLSAMLDTGATNGIVVLNADGNFTYTPNANFNGTDSFTYTVTDGTLEDTGTVNITVAAVNDAPFATDDMASTSEGTAATGNVLLNDTDVDGDTLTAAISTDPSNGTAIINADGSFTYTPNANFNGSDSFTYTASDSSLSDTGTVTITVSAVNGAPVATDDAATTDEDGVATGNVLTNDTDADSTVLTAMVASDPSNGSVTLNTDGSFSYTPDADFNGSDSFTYTVSDGGLSDTATVNITINPVNDAPIGTDDTVATTENTAVTINVIANDIDVDGDTLIISNAGAASQGSVINNNDGTLTYTPNPGVNGTDSFTYTVTDGTESDTATVAVSIRDVNNAPVANDDDIAPIDEDTAAIGNVLTNDTDIDGDTLTAAIATSPSNGTVTLTSDGDFNYTPNANFNGLDSFSYTVSDGSLDDIGFVNLVVAPINDAPIATDDTAATSEGVEVSGNVLTNDIDIDGDELTVTIIGENSSPGRGSVLLSPNGDFVYTPGSNPNSTDSFSYVVSDGLLSDTGRVDISILLANDAPSATDDIAIVDEDMTATGNVLTNDTDAENDMLTAALASGPRNGVVTVNPDGSFEYLPTSNFNGSDNFTYTVSDGTSSDTGTVNVTVNPINDAPLAVNDTAQTTVNNAVAVNVLGNDSDIDGDMLTIDSVTNPQSGTAVISNGTVLYTPNAGFQGNDSFTYTITDGEFSATATASITVNQRNTDRVLTATNDAVSTDEDTVLRGNVLSDNGSGPDRASDGGAFRVIAVNDRLTDLGQEIVLGQGLLTVNADGTFVFNPNGGYDSLAAGETVVERFRYDISGRDGGFDTATVSITINGRDEVVVPSNPTVNGKLATVFVDTNGNVVGSAFQAGQPYSGSLFSNTDTGTNSNDIILGTAGNDNIWAGAKGSDTIDSGAGNDIVGFGEGDAWVKAGAGNDFVYAIGNGGGTNTIDLGNGDNQFYAKAGNNNVTAAGNNLIGIGKGSDTVTTFGGNDFVYSVDGGGGTNVLNLGNGVNTVWVEQGNYDITTGSGNDIIGLGTGTDKVRAGDGNNVIYQVSRSRTSDGAKDILTGAGNDYIQTGGGDDLIDAGAGTNTLFGGSGMDTFTIRKGAYNVLRDFEVGIDKIQLDNLSMDNLTYVRGTGDQGASVVFIFADGKGIAGITNATIAEIDVSTNFV